MMIFILSVLIIIVAVLSCVDISRKQKFLKKLGNVERIPYLPLIGSVHLFLLKGLRAYLNEWTTNTESSSLLWIFTKPIYYTKKPEELQTILLNKNALSKCNAYKFTDILQDSILACDVNNWKIHRRLLNRCFNQKQMFDCVPLFNQFADILSNQISNEMTLREFGELAERSFLNMFYASLGNSGTKDFTSFLNYDVYIAVKSLEPSVIKRYFNPWLYPDFIYYKTEYGKKAKEMLDTIGNSFLEIMKRSQEHTNENETNLTMKYDFMKILVNEYEPHQMKSEMILFSVASSETTGSTFMAITLLLGMHQDVQEKVYQEILTVVGTDHSVESFHIPQLEYTGMAINESMRLFPAGLFIARRADEDIKLDDTKTLPKGTDIFISINHLHRDSGLWKDPLKFIPERFSPEEVEQRHPCSFIPFSYGMRNCIAVKYSEIAMKIKVASLVRKYRIISDCQSVADIDVPPTIVIQLPGHLKLKFEQRNN